MQLGFVKSGTWDSTHGTHSLKKKVGGGSL